MFVKLQCNTFRPDPKPEPKEKKKPKPIKKVGEKRKDENITYKFQRTEFLKRPENKNCFIEGCKRRANSVEHIRGRKGFADDWARQNNVSLLLDERFWKPCCVQHNLELENNPALSKKYQLSKIHNGKK